MRSIAAAMTLVFGLAAARPAVAGKCYVDSDCPTGAVCNSEGGCVVPSGYGGNGNGSARPRSSAAMLLGVLVLGVVIVAILVPAMRATDEANGVRARLDDALGRRPAHDAPPATCGLTLRF